jgi:tetratricopeptide (TPR) repeat protein
LFIAISLSVSTYGQKDKEYFDKAQKLINELKPKEALEYYDKAIMINSTKDQYYRERGYAYIALNKLPEAKADYNKALSLNPNCCRCFMWMGWMNYMEGKDDSALSLANKAVAMCDSDAYLYQRRAYIETGLKLVLSAEKDFNYAITLKPKDADLWASRGQYKSLGGLNEEAVADYDKAIYLNQTSPVYYMLRAKSNIMLGRYSDCMNDLDNARKLDIKNIDDWVDLRMAVYNSLKHPVEIVKDLDKIVEDKIATYNTFYTRAQMKYRMDDLDGCCTDMQTAINMYKLSDAYKEGDKNIEYARKFYKSVCDTATEAFYYQHGVASYNMGEYEKSIFYYNQGLKKYKASPLLYNFKGNSCLMLGRYKESLINYRNFLRKKEQVLPRLKEGLRPDGGEYTDEDVKNYVSSNYECMASAYFELGDTASARGYMDTAIMYNPTRPELQGEIYAERARFELHTAQYASAMKDADKAIEVSPGDARGYRMKAAAKLAYTQNIDGAITIAAEGVPWKNVLMPNWDIKKITVPQANDKMLKTALDDIEKCIKLEPEASSSYFISALIKRSLLMPDYCDDLQKASKLNYTKAQDAIDKLCPH